MMPDRAVLASGSVIKRPVFSRFVPRQNPGHGVCQESMHGDGAEYARDAPLRRNSPFRIELIGLLSLAQRLLTRWRQEHAECKAGLDVFVGHDRRGTCRRQFGQAGGTAEGVACQGIGIVDATSTAS